MGKTARSSWGGMCCSTERDQNACLSWLGNMIPAEWGKPFRADVLTDFYTDDEKKIRAFFRLPDGTMREVSRTLGRTRSTIRSRSIVNLPVNK